MAQDGPDGISTLLSSSVAHAKKRCHLPLIRGNPPHRFVGFSLSHTTFPQRHINDQGLHSGAGLKPEHEHADIPAPCPMLAKSKLASVKFPTGCLLMVKDGFEIAEEGALAILRNTPDKADLLDI